MKKLKIGILFGGRSAEHKVSLMSAKNVIKALDKKKFEPILIGINKKGYLYSYQESNYLLNKNNADLVKLSESNKEIVISRIKKEGQVLIDIQNNKYKNIDVFFPVMHGPYGEDGTIQGLLKFFDIPFVGPSVLGSSVAMDKDITKKLLSQAGILNSKYVVFKDYQKKKINFDKIKDQLGLPLFVKPANLGSSVGVSKVTTKNEIEEAVETAFKYDKKILIEKMINGQEIECSVLGLENNIKTASVLGEVISQNKEGFYSYNAKYIDESGAVLKIPANISEDVKRKVQETAKKTFLALDLEIMSRVDCFVTKENEVYVNEVNTIPGFTNISMYPKLWEESGVNQKELVTKLIELAILRHNKEKKLKSDL